MEIIQAVSDNNCSKVEKDFYNLKGVLKTHLELTVVLFMFCPAQMAYDLGLATAGEALS